jgi:YD repeat-containing protein
MGEIVSRGGGRWLLLVVLVAAGFVGLALQGSRSSAEDGARAGAVARDKVGDVLERATPVPSLSTETSKTYRRADGTFVTRVFAQSKAGDSTLTRAAGGGFLAVGDGATTTFPATLVDPVKIRRGDEWVALELDGGQGAGTPDGSTITYDNALPGVDVRYRASNGAVGEDLHLRSPDSPSRYTFALSASAGVRATTQDNGTIALTDADGHRIFSLSPSYAFADRDRDATQKVTTKLSQVDGGWRVTLSVDAAWLRDALARGPVTIDPTVELQGATKDCSLTSDTPTLSFCSDDQLWIGWSGDHDHHSLMKWDLSAVPKDAVALWGDVGLYQPSAYGLNVSKDLTLHRVTRDWTNGASWNTYDGTHAWTTPGGDFEATAAATATVPAHHGGWTDWSTTTLVQHWVDGSLPNYGVLIQDKPGPHATGEEDYFSTEGTIPAQAPELDIVWTTRTGKPDFYTFESQGLDAKSNVGVNAANGNLLLATNDISSSGTGLDLKLDHYHNSLADPAEVSALGIRGTASLGRDVHLHAYDAQTIGFSRGDGVTLPFVGAATSGTTTTWGTPAELTYATLGKSSSTNQYTLHLPAGLPTWPSADLTLTFDVVGKLLSVKNAAGNTIALSYYAQGAMEYPALGGITDTNNVFWDVDRAYIGNERIVDITHPDNHHTVFGYLNTYDDYLTKVTEADNTTNKYAYDTSHRLKSITAADGSVTLITYNGTSSKVASIIKTTNTAHTTGPTTTFTYSSPTAPCQSTNFDFAKTVVQRPDTTSTTYCANDHAQITYDTDNPTTATASGEWYDLRDQYTQGTGTHSITLAGADAGAGVKKLALQRVGGIDVASSTQGCDPRNATAPTACPHTATATVSFDPSAVPEGAQSFRPATTDYAGTTTTGAAWVVNIDRTGPVFASGFTSGASLDPATNTAVIDWDGASDPDLPGDVAGSGMAGYVVRTRPAGGTWSAWVATNLEQALVAGAHDGQVYNVEVQPHDQLGNLGAVKAFDVTVTGQGSACQATANGYPPGCSDDPGGEDTTEPEPATLVATPSPGSGGGVQSLTAAYQYTVHIGGGGWKTIRRWHNSYVIGNVHDGWQFDQVRQDYTDTDGWITGKIYGQFNACGWIQFEPQTSDDEVQTSCPQNLKIDVDRFADGVNCSSCNRGTPIQVIRPYPQCRNVAPPPTDNIPTTCLDAITTRTTDQAVKDGYEVAWRYVTNDNRFVLVDDTNVDDSDKSNGFWVFMDRRAFRTPSLCTRNAIQKYDCGPPS